MIVSKVCVDEEEDDSGVHEVSKEDCISDPRQLLWMCVITNPCNQDYRDFSNDNVDNWDYADDRIWYN